MISMTNMDCGDDLNANSLHQFDSSSSSMLCEENGYLEGLYGNSEDQSFVNGESDFLVDASESDHSGSPKKFTSNCPLYFGTSSRISSVYMNYTYSASNPSLNHNSYCHESVNGIEDFIDLDLRPVASVASDHSEVVLNYTDCDSSYVQTYSNALSEESESNNYYTRSVCQSTQLNGLELIMNSVSPLSCSSSGFLKNSITELSCPVENCFNMSVNNRLNSNYIDLTAKSTDSIVSNCFTTPSFISPVYTSPCSSNNSEVLIQGCLDDELDRNTLDRADNPSLCCNNIQMTKNTICELTSTSSSTYSVCTLKTQIPAASGFDYPNGALSNEPVMTNALMLIPTCELASGDSLTCAVVNILRGLRLLDRCGVEDLCASLHEFWNDSCPIPVYPSHAASNVPTYPNHVEDCTAVTRSSSFTSYDLVLPKKLFGGRKTKGFYNSNDAFMSKSCLVNYLLACSYAGTSFLLPTSLYQSDGTNPHCCFRPIPNSNLYMANSNSSQAMFGIPNGMCSSNVDWRRGCSDNLVLMLTHHHLGLKNNPVSVDKLLTGRFLSGPHAWRCVWPDRVGTTSCGVDQAKQLAQWFAAWIRSGSVPVLAQLGGEHQDLGPNESCSMQLPQELNWSHRVVYGVTKSDEIYLTNPNELVPVRQILDSLSRQTEIRISKAQIHHLWSKHFSPSKSAGSTDYNLAASASFCSGEGLPLLVQHPDSRWASMNIMGQVLCTLRNLERWTDFIDNQSSNQKLSRTSAELEHFSTSSAIVIPSSQSPGISLFVAKSNWELVRSLFRLQN